MNECIMRIYVKETSKICNVEQIYGVTQLATYRLSF